jgi:hypothetical protein
MNFYEVQIWFKIIIKKQILILIATSPVPEEQPVNLSIKWK